jgi:hypothetical protein
MFILVPIPSRQSLHPNLADDLLSWHSLVFAETLISGGHYYTGLASVWELNYNAWTLVDNIGQALGRQMNTDGPSTKPGVKCPG